MLLLLCSTPISMAQGIPAQPLPVQSPSVRRTLDFFLSAATENAPSLRDYQNQLKINTLEQRINEAQHEGLRVWLSGDYLLAPFFNNHGVFVTTTPSPEAIGYDAGLTNGGLYSALVNVERDILNGGMTAALSRQSAVKDETLRYGYELEKRNLLKQITDQYIVTLQRQLQVRLSQESTDNLHEQLQLTGALVQKGLSSARDYLLLKIETEGREMEQRDAAQQYRSSLRQLYAACGISDTTMEELEAVAIAPSETGDGSTFLRKFELDSLAAAAGQVLSETKYAPQLRVFANSGLNAVELHSMERKFGVSAGFSLTLPLFDGGQRELTQQQNMLARSSIADYRRHTVQMIRIQRDDSRERLHSLQRTLRELATQISDYNGILDLSVRQLRDGSLSMIDYLSLMRGFIDIRKREIDTRTAALLETNTLNYWSW
ncbi:MAG: TolC family protein [Bacteroidetes bacterium]|nr:TolC family protein [Bacteroidota bacterium]